MEITRYLSQKPRTPYAPSWDFAIAKDNLPIDVEKLSITCLEKEEEVLKLPISTFKTESGEDAIFDGYTGLGANCTTAKSWLYNVFDWNTPETNSLRKFLKDRLNEYNKRLENDIPKVYYVQCWHNVLRYGQKIQPHAHSFHDVSYLSAHFTVQCENTSTFYINPVNQLNDPQLIEEKNKPGNLSIFPECVPHYTTEHLSDTPRITVAMDIRTFNPPKDSTGLWIEL